MATCYTMACFFNALPSLLTIKNCLDLIRYSNATAFIRQSQRQKPEKIIALYYEKLELADHRDKLRVDDGFGVGCGIRRDAACKLRRTAEKEISLHERNKKNNFIKNFNKVLIDYLKDILYGNFFEWQHAAIIHMLRKRY